VATDPADGGDVVDEPELPLPPPGQIRALTPHISDRRAAEDWNRIVDDLYDQKFDRAQAKLTEWEQRWGATRETRNLRQQLDALPAD
jgi:hypothetical protein